MVVREVVFADVIACCSGNTFGIPGPTVRCPGPGARWRCRSRTRRPFHNEISTLVSAKVTTYTSAAALLSLCSRSVCHHCATRVLSTDAIGATVLMIQFLL